jgi:hypothetical protein
MLEGRNLGKGTYVSHEELCVYHLEIQCHIICWKATEILEERVVYIFRVEE